MVGEGCFFLVYRRKTQENYNTFTTTRTEKNRKKQIAKMTIDKLMLIFGNVLHKVFSKQERFSVRSINQIKFIVFYEIAVSNHAIY